MTKSTPLVFFGNNHFSLPVLKALYKDGWLIEYVVTYQITQIKNRTKSENPVLEFATENGINTICLNNFSSSDNYDKLQNPKSQIAVLASFGQIIPAQVINYFKLGIINIHPSLLPRWRGPSPIESAILNGDHQTGVCLMKMVDKIDAGPIYACRRIELSDDETQDNLYQSLSLIGSELLIEKLPLIVSDRLSPVDQDEKKATYCKMISKSDGAIDWNSSCPNIERQIRAYQRWPKSHTSFSGRDLIISKAHIDEHNPNYDKGIPYVQNGILSVNCQDGSIVIDRIQPAGGKEMSASEFIRGYMLKT